MSRIAMDVRAQNSWKELIEKEATTRLLCNFKREETKEDDEWFNRSKYSQKRSTITQLELPPQIKFPPRPVRQNPADAMNELAEQLKATNQDLSRDMRTPDEATKKILYDGFTKEEKGRYLYLKTRKSANPEDKYEHPVVSSFEYGWKLNEVAPKYKTPENGRSKIVEESFYRRNGVL